MRLLRQSLGLALIVFSVATQPGAASDPPASLGLDKAALFDVQQPTFLAADDTVWLPSPRGALLRSLAVPGWGQLYNRQYLKVPIVVGGMATLIGVSVHSNNRAILFRRAAIYDDCVNQPGQIDPAFCVDAEAYAREFQRADELTAGPLTAGAARSLRDQFRRQRDLFILLSTLVYGLQALDAYVAAELADFDVGEDLALGVTATPTGPSLHLRWRF